MILAIKLTLIVIFAIAWFLGMHWFAYQDYKQREAERKTQ